IAKARIYGGSNLDCPDIRVPEGISLDQVKEIFDQHYVPTNMTLILVGHFDDARIDALLQQTFAQLPVRAATQRAPVQFSDINYKPLQEKRAMFDPEVDVHLFIPAVGSVDPANDAYQIVAEYLGEQLYYDVRGQRGMAYTPRALVDNNSLYGYLQATTRTSDRWYEDVITLFKDKYAQVRQQGVPQADVERLRQKLILEFESKQRDNSELAQLYRHYRHIIREQGRMPDLVERLQQVDAAQVKAAIDQHFPPQPLMAVLRPPTGKEIFLKVGPMALVLGAIGVLLLRWSHRRRISAITKK
ncbi:MAG TPA: insulinase family protein, partial [Dongiaceae bacterium]|nr:insulinase family protein [Dongiaceae bacterium]